MHESEVNCTGSCCWDFCGPILSPISYNFLSTHLLNVTFFSHKVQHVFIYQTYLFVWHKIHSFHYTSSSSINSVVVFMGPFGPAVSWNHFNPLITALKREGQIYQNGGRQSSSLKVHPLSQSCVGRWHGDTFIPPRSESTINKQGHIHSLLTPHSDTD